MNPEAALLLREFVAGGGDQASALAAIRKVLPKYIDDLTRDFGAELYERMATDDAVNNAVDTMALSVIAEGVGLEARVAMPTETSTADPETAEIAAEYEAFVARCFETASPSIDEAAYELTWDSIVNGHGDAEIVLGEGEGEDVGLLDLEGLRPKSWKLFGLVVDAKGHLVALDPGTEGTEEAKLLPLEAGKRLIPRYKFVHFAPRRRAGRPQGLSFLRPAYDAWFLKTSVLPEYFKFLRQFASPGIIGKTPPPGVAPDFVPDTDEQGRLLTGTDGNPVLITAEQALLRALLAWQNAVAIAVKGGTEIDFLQSDGDGKAFLAGFDYCDRRIQRAILGTDGLSMGSTNDSLGAKEVGQDVAGLRIAYLKGRLGAVLTRELSELLIEVNFGKEARALAPRVVLTRAEQQDWAREAEVIGNLFAKGYLHKSQQQALDARLGLPPRDMEMIAAEEAESRHQAALIAGEVGRIEVPGAEEEL